MMSPVEVMSVTPGSNKPVDKYMLRYLEEYRSLPLADWLEHHMIPQGVSFVTLHVVIMMLPKGLCITSGGLV